MEEEDDDPLSLTQAKEYVKQQLLSLGVNNVTERDLEAYTKGSACFMIDNILQWFVSINRLPTVAERERRGGGGRRNGILW